MDLGEKEKLIRLIEKQPAIWDSQCKENKDRQLREHAWSEVGRALHSNWFKLESVEQQEKLKDIKTKWRYIRDYYVKYRRGLEEGTTIPKTICGNMLMFLNSQPIRKRNKLKQKPANDSSTDIEFMELNDSTYYDPLHVHNTESTQLAYAEDETTQDEHEHQQGEADPDKEALLSLLSDYRNLTREQKIDFRIHSLQFFRNIYGQNSDAVP